MREWERGRGGAVLARREVVNWAYIFKVEPTGFLIFWLWV